MSFSGWQHVVIRTALLVSCSSSLVGGLFIVINYILVSSQRNPTTTLVALLSVSDIGIAVFSLIGFATHYAPLCVAQAIGLQFFGVCSMMWVLMLSLNTYLSVFWIRSNFETRLRWFVCIAYGIPLTFLIPLLIFNDFGNAGPGWCWIGPKHTFLRLLLYYVPATLVYCLIAFFYCLVKRRVSKSISLSHAQYDTLLTKVSKRTTLYLIIYLVCELPGLVNRLQGYISPDHPQWWLYLIQVIFQGAEGFLNAAVYGMRYWKHWKCASFCRVCVFCE